MVSDSSSSLSVQFWVQFLLIAQESKCQSVSTAGDNPLLGTGYLDGTRLDGRDDVVWRGGSFVREVRDFHRLDPFLVIHDHYRERAGSVYRGMEGGTRKSRRHHGCRYRDTDGRNRCRWYSVSLVRGAQPWRPFTP